VDLRNVVVSIHASRRANERGIPEELIKAVINEPQETVNVKFGRKASFKEFGDYYIVVIYEDHKDEIVVVTVVKVDKKRLKRYGFSRV
jgi:hypothetical protein